MNGLNVVFLTLFLFSVLATLYALIGVVIALISKKRSLFHLMVSSVAIIAINTIVKLLMYFDKMGV